MRSLQTLLTILGGQHLTAGYLTPSGSGTALETVIYLMFTANDPIYVLSNPITPPGLLNCPAYVSNRAGFPSAIYLNGVDGNLATSQGPAYIMA